MIRSLALILVYAEATRWRKNLPEEGLLREATSYASIPWPIYYLNNSVGVEMDATCLDGTPGAFYYRLNASSTQWRVFFQGGGWCYDALDCAQRATTDLGSSKGYAASIANGGGGMMSTDPLVNPTFYGANTIYLKYCDGDSFAGARAEPLDVPGGAVSSVKFRGQAIVDAALATLLAEFGMTAATELVLTGSSAGGLATYLHADSVGAWATEQLPHLRAYGAVPVSGNFLRRETVLGFPVYPDEMRTIFNLSHAALGGVPRACLDAKSSANAWQCNFAREAYAVSTVPLFLLDSSLDSWSTSNIMAANAPNAWRDCCSKQTDCTPEQIFSIWAWQGDFITSLATTAQRTKKGNGAFVYNCHTHCAGTSSGSYTAFTLDGTTMADAVDKWWRALGDVDYDATDHTYTDSLYNADGSNPNPTC